MSSAELYDERDEVAVIGMAGRFPGAGDVDQFWRNLRDGVESITAFTDEELIEAGIDPATVRDPGYVKVGGVLEGVEMFDASFFGLSAREAAVMDPQHRFFMECAWEAMEDAGYDAEQFDGRVGVFAGAGINKYLFNLFANPAVMRSIDAFSFTILNDKDFVPTRVSYKMNLKGPSINVQTACSTSLVAACVACQSLLNGDCDMAMAGGVSIKLPQKIGWFYQDGGVLSPDGHCRAFDADARGTVGGRGAAVVVLKRLADALRDGDRVLAVIKGFAVNNDGSVKIGYTAPSVEGQAAVITEALSMAGVSPETVSYVECHGTGTALGDPIEVTALTQAFRAYTERKGFCAIGSLKTNVGHLDTAAGVAGLIKTVLALKHRQLPPSLNFRRPNPQIDFENSPFFVNTELRPWEPAGGPLRAGVSSFGIGGTNAHVVLEEAPAPAPTGPSRRWQSLVLSARSAAALEHATDRLAEHCERHPELNLADAAYTLKVGRKEFDHRRVVLCRDGEEAVRALKTRDAQRCFDSFQEAARRPVAFMFPGGGAQHVGMGRDLYETEPAFRREMDACAELVRAEMGYDLLAQVYPEESRREEAARGLERTSVGLPALFAVEYALTKLWMSWGVRPDRLIGHSLGEYTAACLAGVFSLEDAVAMVCLRGRLIEELPGGTMLSVALSEEEVRPLIAGRLSLAAINSPSQCVVSGSTATVDGVAEELAARGVEFRKIRIAAAGHSEMVTPILQRFVAFVETLSLQPPRIDFVSNVTGDWITPQQATDPEYWGRHLRHTVRFADGLARMAEDPARLLLEVGPGQTLSTLAKMQSAEMAARAPIPSMRHPLDSQPDDLFLQTALGKLWLAGGRPAWREFYKGEVRRRVALPTYPFERRRYWVDPQKVPADSRRHGLARKPDLTDWFYIPSWRRSMPPRPAARGELAEAGRRWLLFVGEDGFGAELAARLREEAQEVFCVRAGDAYAQGPGGDFTLDPRSPENYAALVRALEAGGGFPATVLHCWNISAEEAGESGLDYFERAQDEGYFSLLYLARALGAEAAGRETRLVVLSDRLHDTAGEEADPEKSPLLGPCKVIPQEYPNVSSLSVDVRVPPRGTPQRELLAGRLLAECLTPSADAVVAYRGDLRLVQSYEAVGLKADAPAVRPLRERGVYVITGGLGKVGLLLAEFLAKNARARLALLSRTQLPPREEWEGWLAEGGEETGPGPKIKRLLELEALGAEVFCVSADVADEGQLREAFRRIDERYGEPSGVIHAAGVLRGPSFLNPLSAIGREESRAQFAPKVAGLFNLEKVLRGRALDFCLLLSSNASVLGGMGFVAYSAANLFLDAFAADRGKRGGFPWISSNWDGWLADEAPLAAMRTSMDEYAMAPSESTEAFRRVVTQATVSQVVVSPGDLSARLDLWIHRRAQEAAAADEEEEIETFVTRAELRTSYVAPESEVEGGVVKIWQRLLGVKQVGVNDNFFELGGHSLLASQVVTALREAYHVELPLRSIFETPTVAGLAARIEAALQRSESGAEPAPTAPPLLAVARDGDLPLSYAQERLWFLHQLDPTSPAYNLPLAVRLSGSLDAAALARALSEVVRRHEALRTCFRLRDGRPVQVVCPAGDLGLPVVDLSELSEEERETETMALASDEAGRPFDLTEAAPLRLLLVRLGEEQHALVLVMHHIISDGWSMGVLVREVAALYGAYQRGEASPLAELPVQYADYAVWQREWLEGGELDRQVSYWRERLQGAAPPELPTDRARPDVRGYRGGHEAVRLGHEESRRLKELGASSGATLFVVLLAAFAALLERYSGGGEAVVGTPSAGRVRREVEGLIGFFVNTLVVRVGVRREEGFAILVGRVREAVVEAQAHQDVPFERLVQALQPERSLSHSPLFHTWFVFQPLERQELGSMPGLTLTNLRLPVEVVRHDLRLDLTEHEDGISGSLQYSADLFEPATVERMARSFERLVRALASLPHEELRSVLEALAEEERAERSTKARTFESADRQLLKSLRRKAPAAAEDGEEGVAEVVQN